MRESVLDTDIYSEVQKGRDRHVERNAAQYRAMHGTYTITLFTIVEVIKGYQKRLAHDRVRAIRASLPHLKVLPFDVGTADLAGQIQGDLDRAGQPIGRMDPLIAATAIRYDHTLVTGNTRHYQRIIDLGYPLRTADWRDATAS